MVSLDGIPPQKILVLAAIPQESIASLPIRLDVEIREIEDAIRRSIRRDRFDLRTRTAVRARDIRRAIAEEQPQIVHFCGHGNPQGELILEDDRQEPKPVRPEALAALLKLHADVVECVLLNACYTEKPAEAISQHIARAIGMNQEIGDEAAIVFTQAFYDALGYEKVGQGDRYERAFKEGITALDLESENPLTASIPVFKKKANDSNRLPNLVRGRTVPWALAIAAVLGIGVSYVYGFAVAPFSPKTPISGNPENSSPPAMTEKVYRGYVVDDFSQQPVDNAQVKFDFGGPSDINFTDSEGQYVLTLSSNTRSKSGRVRVEANGYKIYEREISLDSSDNFERIRLTPLPRYMGRAVDRFSGEPIHEVEVTLNFEGKGYTAFTDSDGYFAINLPETANRAIGRVRFSANGYKIYEQVINRELNGYERQDIRLERE